MSLVASVTGSSKQRRTKDNLTVTKWGYCSIPSEAKARVSGLRSDEVMEGLFRMQQDHLVLLGEIQKVDKSRFLVDARLAEAVRKT